MNKANVVIAVVVIILIIIGAEVVMHNRGNTTSSSAPSQDQITAANECILMCQTAFDASDTGGNSREQACQNTCNTSAGLATSTMVK